MKNGSLKVRIPNPNNSDIGKGLLSEILKQASILREDWDSF